MCTYPNFHSSSLSPRIPCPRKKKRKSQVPVQVFQVNVVCRRADDSDLEYVYPRPPFTLSLLFQREREREPSTVTLKPCTLPQWLLLHPGFEPQLQFASFPAGWQNFGSPFFLSFLFFFFHKVDHVCCDFNTKPASGANSLKKKI